MLHNLYHLFLIYEKTFRRKPSSKKTFNINDYSITKPQALLSAYKYFLLAAITSYTCNTLGLEYLAK